MKEEKEPMIRILFEEFIDSYFYTPEFLETQNIYDNNRKTIYDSFKNIESKLELIEQKDFTDIVLKDLLYLGDSETWKKLCEMYNMNQTFSDDKEQWNTLADNVYNFIRDLLISPEHLQSICNHYLQYDLFKDISLFLISRILNALNRKNFFIILPNSLKLINYLSESSYNLSISNYSVINSLSQKITTMLTSYKNLSSIPFLSDSEIFYYFCDWLYKIKKIENTALIFENKQKRHYTLMELIEDTNLEETQLNQYINTLERKKHIIFQGSSGTGKTYLAKHIAKHLTSSGDGFCELIQFHPSYSYEDFIQGIRPQTSPDGNLEYSMIPGRFLNFCKKAENCEDICILIIDEINRTNLSQVFGELMYLLEYREEEIQLAGSDQTFKIPENVYIIGTMNTADRSIALVDHALRRRFAFIPIKPNYDILRKYQQKHNPNYDIESLINILIELNKTINDPHYEIGVSFFLTKKLQEDLEDIWTMEIEPYLEEYFFNETDKIDKFRWKNI
ncbi:MAG: AAA family ATPase [Crocosphaera sp.]|nr:AAA family ATPase [Crocosphaera sp.]